MSSGGGQTRTENISKSEPWSGVQPFYRKGFAEAETNVLDRPLQFFPGSTVEPFAPETEQALQMQSQRALGGDPNFSAGQQQLQQTLGGDYLNPGNPAQQGMLDRITGDVGRAVDSRYASAGRFGSPAHAEAVGRGISDAYAPLQFGAFENERSRQMGLVPQARDFGNQPYTDAAALGQVGATREALGQEQTAEDVARHTFEQLEPSQRIGQFMQLLGGGYGGQTTSFGTSRGGGGGLGGIGEGIGLGIQGLGMAFPGGLGTPTSAGGAGTVICTELHRRGWLDDNLYRGDDAYGKTLEPGVMAGYHAWGKPLANAMRRYTWLAALVWVIARPVIHEMAAHGGHRFFGSLTGQAMLAVGLPMCRWIGRRCNQEARHAA